MGNHCQVHRRPTPFCALPGWRKEERLYALHVLVGAAFVTWQRGAFTPGGRRGRRWRRSFTGLVICLGGLLYGSSLTLLTAAPRCAGSPALCLDRPSWERPSASAAEFTHTHTHRHKLVAAQILLNNISNKDSCNATHDVVPSHKS